jgi:hypothetical protein
MKKEKERELTLNDISLGKYCEIVSIVQDSTLGEADKTIFICNILYGVDISKISMSEALPYINNSIKLLNTDIPTNAKTEDYYILGDKKYRFTTDISKINLMQFLDFQTYIQEDNTINNYNKILSVFLVPEGVSYNDDSYNITELQSLIDKELSITEAYNMGAFFLQQYKRYLRIFQNSLIWEVLTMKGMKWKEKKAILKQIINGDFYHLSLK